MNEKFTNLFNEAMEDFKKEAEVVVGYEVEPLGEILPKPMNDEAIATIEIGEGHNVNNSIKFLEIHIGGNEFKYEPLSKNQINVFEA